MPLTPEQLYFAERLFELKVMHAVGQGYQDLFTRVMELRYPDFRTVKPQGNLGDKKNDGYHSSIGRYFQVYAPEQHDSEDLARTIGKIEEDFAGLIKFWATLAPVTEFHFVLNDRFRGTYPSVEAVLLKIKKQHSLTQCGPFLAKDLMRVFGELEERHVMAIAGFIPSADAIADLDFSLFSDVLAHVIKTATAIAPPALLRVPDFSDKIRLNGILPNVAALLQAASLQSGAVETYFNTNGTFSKRAIRDKLAENYVTLRDGFDGQKGGCRADVIFFGLLEAVTPPPVSKAVQDAAIVLLAYFFESCDIYEDPALF